ncbi:MAG: radical SAM protein [Candidatus Omnitrophica bacterium]|nr:radical SAM protein [Candidatus Omnitrophota bacterium]
MKKVFLVNPLALTDKKERIHFLRDYSGAEIPTSMAYPPLDLSYVAAILRENNIPVTLLDASTLNLPPSEVLKPAAQERPDFIGIPSAWGSIPFDIELAKELKNRLPSVKIVIWGVNVTANPEIALSSGYIDFVILGEPEKPFLDIVNGVLAENVAYKSGGKTILAKRSLLENLDSLPFPARDLLPNAKYTAPYARKNPFTSVSTSRGCPYSKCNFCPTNIWYMNRVRYRSVENVMQEIGEIINKLKIHSIIFRDQSLTFEQERLINICNEIISRKHPVSWRCFSGVGIRNKKLFSIMKKAGCYQINYGFESGSQEILDLNNKGTTLEESREAVRLTREAGIEVSGSFMLGMWGDTEETIKKTVDFAISLDIDYAEFILATPLPTTKFYEQCGLQDKTGTFISQRWYNRSYNSNLLLKDNFLEKQLKSAYKRFYFRPAYIFSRLCNNLSLERLFLQSKSAVSLFRKIWG